MNEKNTYNERNTYVCLDCQEGFRCKNNFRIHLEKCELRKIRVLKEKIKKEYEKK